MNCDKKRKIRLKRCKLDNKGLVEAKKLLRKTKYNRINKRINKNDINDTFIKRRIELKNVKTDLYNKDKSHEYMYNNLYNNYNL